MPFPHGSESITGCNHYNYEKAIELEVFQIDCEDA